MPQIWSPEYPKFNKHIRWNMLVIKKFLPLCFHYRQVTRECMNFYLYIPQFFTDLGEIRYIITSQLTIALFWILWKRVGWKPYFLNWCKAISVLTFVIYCSLLSEIQCYEIMHIMLLKICDILENLQREGHILYLHKLKQSHTCTVKLSDILNVKVTLIKSLYNHGLH
jgi:hypothetical protein